MRKKSLMILGAVLLFFFTSSIVGADTLSVPACGFIAEGHQAEQLQIALYSGENIYRKNNLEEYFWTPVNLPHGSIIKWVKFHVIDNDADYDVFFGLYRANKYAVGTHVIYSATTSGHSPSLRHFTDASPSTPAVALVNNDVCTYYIKIHFMGGSAGLGRRVYGLTIYYE